MKKEEKLFKEINVWKRIDNNKILLYRCFEVLPDNTYFVKCSNYFYEDFDDEQFNRLNKEFAESLFYDSLIIHQEKAYSSIIEAINAHEEEFAN
jgi:hypothetical protein